MSDVAEDAEHVIGGDPSDGLLFSLGWLLHVVEDRGAAVHLFLGDEWQ